MGHRPRAGRPNHRESAEGRVPASSQPGRSGARPGRQDLPTEPDPDPASGHGRWRSRSGVNPAKRSQPRAGPSRLAARAVWPGSSLRCPGPATSGASQARPRPRRATNGSLRGCGSDTEEILRNEPTSHAPRGGNRGHSTGSTNPRSHDSNRSVWASRSVTAGLGDGLDPEG